jgi:hypothetical protein
MNPAPAPKYAAYAHPASAPMSSTGVGHHRAFGGLRRVVTRSFRAGAILLVVPGYAQTRSGGEPPVRLEHIDRCGEDVAGVVDLVHDDDGAAQPRRAGPMGRKHVSGVLLMSDDGPLVALLGGQLLSATINA